MKDILIALNQRPVAYYPIYKTIAGSTTAGILLSQIMYWSSAVKGKEFYKPDIEIIEETGLSKNELRAAKKKLKTIPFIKMRLSSTKKYQAVTFYEVDYRCYALVLSRYSEIHESGIVKFTKSNSLISRNQISEFHELLYTETTTETTTEITSSITVPEPEPPQGVVENPIKEKCSKILEFFKKHTGKRIYISGARSQGNFDRCRKTLQMKEKHRR